MQWRALPKCRKAYNSRGYIDTAITLACKCSWIHCEQNVYMQQLSTRPSNLKVNKLYQSTFSCNKAASRHKSQHIKCLIETCTFVTEGDIPTVHILAS